MEDEALFAAIAEGNLFKIKEAIAGGGDVNARNSCDKAALIIVARQRITVAARLLLGKGTGPMIEDAKGGIASERTYDAGITGTLYETEKKR